MLKVNLLTGTSNNQVQDIYNEIDQIKAGFGSRLSQIQDSYKYNQQNQGNGGNGNTQDQFAYNDTDSSTKCRW